MAEYMIKMADERGHCCEQLEHGTSEVEIRDRFAQQGFLVYSVKPKGLLSADLRLPQRRKIRQDQFVIFNQQFVTLIHAGLPIIQSLELLMKRQRNPFFRSVLQNVRDRLRGGELLSEAFAAQKVFPKVYTTTLLAGEKSGNLEEVMARYIAFQRLSVSFRKKLTGIAGLSHAAGCHAVGDVDVPDHFCGAAVRQPVSPAGIRAASDDRGDAGHRRQRQALLSLYAAGAGRWQGFSSGAG